MTARVNDDECMWIKEGIWKRMCCNDEVGKLENGYEMHGLRIHAGMDGFARQGIVIWLG